MNAPTELEFAVDDALTGFRLQAFEVLNWGTFHRHVWRIAPNARNALLTGDIGSGKSTLVDALTSLLVPHQRIVYNKAAGAEGRERSLYSYIRGEYKSEQDQETQAARAVALRDDNSYSVLLARFHNSGYAQSATLAQVFWIKDGQRNPERFFVFAETELSIAEHFADFGSDILKLKKRLKRSAKVQVFDNFKEYSSRFRRLFGIQEEKALELFYQTVSMKSVGNLTEFVRSHMLEQVDVESRISQLRRAFDNLNRAHQAVLKAKAQIQRLTPLVADGAAHRQVMEELAELSACRDSLEPWFAGHAVRLGEQRISRLERELGALERRLERVRQEVDELRAKGDSIKAGIEDQGGSRLRAIDQEVKRLEPERELRRKTLNRYQLHRAALELAPATDDAAFQGNRERAEALKQSLESDAAELDLRRTDLAVDLRGLKQQGQEIERELVSLRRRKSNIPLRNLQLRELMAADLSIPEEELPFAGELLQVAADEAPWEGVIERLLHSTALSLLVPDRHYAAVSRYVERTNLGGRLVYYHTGERERRAQARGSDPRSLFRKLRIRPESPFYDWLSAWLANSFDHICCDELSDFRRLPKAVSRHGQIKTGGRRHEKDDRHALQDRSRYVLGWSNREKIAVLEQQLDGLAGRITDLAMQSTDLDRSRERINGQRDHARDLLNIDRFEAIDWPHTAAAIQELLDEKQRIEESSDTLKDLRTQLRVVEGAIRLKGAKQEQTLSDKGRVQNQLQEAGEQLRAARELADAWDPLQREHLAPQLQALHRETPDSAEPSLQNLIKQQSLLRKHIQALIDALAQRRNRLRERLIAAMQSYKTDFPAETQEVDAAVDALPEYDAMLAELEGEGLPRHEARFREMLREETIQGVAMFQALLDKEQHRIDDKIGAINRSLEEIEYSPGTYITLGKDPSGDNEVREFQQQLRQVLSGALDEDQLYTEEKFLQVKAILDRFNGREGLIDQDRRWTRKVTDVRNWFNFSASERYREDNSEKEFYSDAAGKSGGQKEKLAYTILASALAYQFGLEWGRVRSRSFRFVVIDEAFGKGSDESTRYALELFAKLNLQLLIVTPLQKIHIIEDYIDAVHFVHNEGGRNSVIRNLTVEEYRREKAKFSGESE